MISWIIILCEGEVFERRVICGDGEGVLKPSVVRGWLGG